MLTTLSATPVHDCQSARSVQETRYRQRYLDGIVNHDFLRRVFTTRARVIQKIRRFFDERDFMEVLC